MPDNLPGRAVRHLDGSPDRLLSVATAAVPWFAWRTHVPAVLAGAGRAHPELTTALGELTVWLRRADELVGAEVAGVVEDHLALAWRLLSFRPGVADRARLAAIAAEAAQLAEWQAFDGGRGELAETRYRVALQAARIAGDDRLHAFVLGATAQLLAAEGEPGEALALTTVAGRTAGPGATPATAAFLAVLAADAHARIGDAASADRAFATAESAMGLIHPVMEPPWLERFDRAELLGWRSAVMLRLGRPAAAGAAAMERLAILAPELVRQRALALADLAASHAARAQPGPAAEAAGAALELGRSVGSVRVVAAVAALRAPPERSVG